MRRVAALGALGLVFLATTADAQRRTVRPKPPTSAKEPSATDSARDDAQAHNPARLRYRFGFEVAQRLLQSPDSKQRIRGIRRAARLGEADGTALLVESAERSGDHRRDPRELIEIARALAGRAGDVQARTALATIVRTPPLGALRSTTQRDDKRSPMTEAAELELARDTAAMALARSRDKRAVEALVAIARTNTVGNDAALHALEVSPNGLPSSLRTSALLTPGLVRLAGRSHDLRWIDRLREALASSDTATRIASIRALGELGDGSLVGPAKEALAELNPRLREAGGAALVMIGAAERFAAVAALLGDESTTERGVELARAACDARVAQALVAELKKDHGRARKKAVIFALAHCPVPDAARVLGELMDDPAIGGDAAHALARSVAPGAESAIASGTSRAKSHELALRAWVARALLSESFSGALVDTLRSRRKTRGRGHDAQVQISTFGLVAAGKLSLSDALDDPDPGIRRAAALATLVRPSASSDRKLLVAWANEKDELTKSQLALGLVSGDPDGLVPTRELVARSVAGGIDAPLASLVLAARTTEPRDPNVARLLENDDPTIRAHVALGLGRSKLDARWGRLSTLYRYETSAYVRRAIVRAIGESAGEPPPVARATLAVAARLDPDDDTRWLASRLQKGESLDVSPTLGEWVWIATRSARDAAPSSPVSGNLLRPDLLAVPFVTDSVGFALVGGLDAGRATLRLAPRIPE